ncbi:MAG: hypothetical protein ACLTKB_12350 [Lawsonibacter sp.]
MEDRGFRSAVIEAVIAAYEKDHRPGQVTGRDRTAAPGGPLHRKGAVCT